MRKVLFLLASAPFFVQAQKSPAPAKLSGTIENLTMGVEWVHFSYRNNGARIHDSAQVINNKFSYSAVLAEPTMMTVYPAYKSNPDGSRPALKSGRDYASVFASAGKIKVSHIDSFANVQVKGSAAHDEFKKLNQYLEGFASKQKALGEQWRAFNNAQNAEGMKKIEEEMEKLDEEEKGSRVSYFKQNTQSPIALYMLKSIAGWDLKPDVIDPLWNLLPEKFKAYPSAIAFAEDVNTARKTGIGMVAMDFTQNDPNGKPVSLSSFRGSYVLVDFWATWCMPCLKELPNIRKAKEEFGSNGFEVLSINMDEDLPEARKFLASNPLPWETFHSSDLSALGFKSAIAKRLGINAIPFLVLV
ncbi:MAG: hypothetical protein B7Z54_09160, partial [Sphingobacteriales bacterium 12-47-4]